MTFTDHALARKLLEAEGRVRRMPPRSVTRWVDSGALLIDVREAFELVSGSAPGARHIPRGTLESSIGKIAPRSNQDIIVMCESGTRSLLAADTLCDLGYTAVAHVVGGFKAWREQGLPVAHADTDMGPEAYMRYARHLAMPEVGDLGQRKISRARVMVVGAGGLGSPVALYLAAAGVGELGIIDDDRVERNNLQRQVLHTDCLVGHAKTESAAVNLHALNPQVGITTFPERLNRKNAHRLLSGWSIVVDGSDNFPTRQVINDTCCTLRIPLVYGAVLRFSGQVSVFHSRRDSPCYRCLFPEAPAPGDAPTCAEAGVLGVVPGIIGCLQANEVLKLILGLGNSLSGRLLQFDALTTTFRESVLERDPLCETCGAPAGTAPDGEQPQKPVSV